MNRFNVVLSSAVLAAIVLTLPSASMAGRGRGQAGGNDTGGEYAEVHRFGQQIFTRLNLNDEQRAAVRKICQERKDGRLELSAALRDAKKDGDENAIATAQAAFDAHIKEGHDQIKTIFTPEQSAAFDKAVEEVQGERSKGRKADRGEGGKGDQAERGKGGNADQGERGKGGKGDQAERGKGGKGDQAERGKGGNADQAELGKGRKADQGERGRRGGGERQRGR